MFRRINTWWEGLCHGCGLCCHEKEYDDNNLLYINLEKPCKYLNRCDMSCSVYNNRFKINPECKKVNLFQALFNPYLPSSCGYVEKVRFWKRRKK